MNLIPIIPAFLLGLASSLHCIGMCGPLSLAMPLGNIGSEKRVASLLSYQFGRITTYIVIGIVAGLAGRSILLSGYQQTLSILSGVIVLVAASGYYIGRKTKRSSFFNGFYGAISRLVIHLMKDAAKPAGAFFFGMANGLLPCGMVYIAAVSSVSYGSMAGSAFFMLLFGLGTFPAMLLVAFTRRGLVRYKWLSRITPVAITMMGALLIIRGLDLNIPYLSPALLHAAPEAISCH